MSPFKIGVVQFPDSELATLESGRVLFGSEIHQMRFRRKTSHTTESLHDRL